MANLRNSKNFEYHHFPGNLDIISSMAAKSQNHEKDIRRATRWNENGTVTMTAYFYRGTMILKTKHIFEKKIKSYQ